MYPLGRVDKKPLADWDISEELFLPTLPHLRAKAYTTLVRPILEYSSTVWDGSLTQTQATKLEAVQRRAARTVHNIPRTDHHTSTSQLINKLNWETLDSRREWRRLGLFRAIHFGEVATDMTEYIQIHPHSSSTRRHDQQYFIPHCNTDIHKKSFFISTAKLWNNLCSLSSLLVVVLLVRRKEHTTPCFDHLLTDLLCNNIDF